MPTYPPSCPDERAACPHCAGGVCPSANDAEPSTVRGPCLVGSAIGLFLLPVLLAIGGAVAAGPNETAQLVGALVGLGIGMAGSILAARWIAPWRKNNG